MWLLHGLKRSWLSTTFQPMLSGRLLPGFQRAHGFHRAPLVSQRSGFQRKCHSSRWHHLGIGVISTRCLSSRMARKRPGSEGSWTCSRRDCGGIIREEDARVEAAISLKGEPTRADSLIKWQDGTAMAFHRSCWESLLQERSTAYRCFSFLVSSLSCQTCR